VIGFRSGEGACGHCPLSFLCLLGKPLIIDKPAGDTYLGEDFRYHKKRVQFNDLCVTYCPRCFCVHFEIKHERYLCGILRTGLMHRGTVEPGRPAIEAAMGGNRRGAVRLTSGCAHTENRPHPLSFEAGVKLIDKKTGQVRACFRDESRYDCFDEFKKMLTEVY
jgi:hypothetical protein